MNKKSTIHRALVATLAAALCCGSAFAAVPKDAQNDHVTIAVTGLDAQPAPLLEQIKLSPLTDQVKVLPDAFASMDKEMAAARQSMETQMNAIMQAATLSPAPMGMAVRTDVMGAHPPVQLGADGMPVITDDSAMTPAISNNSTMTVADASTISTKGNTTVVNLAPGTHTIVLKSPNGQTMITTTSEHNKDGSHSMSYFSSQSYYSDGGDMAALSESQKAIEKKDMSLPRMPQDFTRVTKAADSVIPPEASATIHPYTMSIPLVSLPNQKAAAAINNDIMHRAHEAFSRFQALPMHVEGSFSYTIKYENADYLSIVFPVFTYNGGAHGIYSEQGVVYDKHTGAQLPLSYFVRLKDNNQITDMLKTDSLKFYNQGLKRIDYNPEFNATNNKVPTNYCLVGDGSIYLIYEPYALSYGANGATRVLLTAKDIKRFNEINKDLAPAPNTTNAKTPAVPADATPANAPTTMM